MDTVHAVRFYGRLMAALALAFVVASTATGWLVLQRLERAVQVSERLEAKIELVLKAAAPLGKAAVDRGVEAINEVDAKKLGHDAADGLRDVGRAVRDRALDRLRTSGATKN